MATFPSVTFRNQRYRKKDDEKMELFSPWEVECFFLCSDTQKKVPPVSCCHPGVCITFSQQAMISGMTTVCVCVCVCLILQSFSLMETGIKPASTVEEWVTALQSAGGQWVTHDALGHVAPLQQHSACWTSVKAADDVSLQNTSFTFRDEGLAENTVLTNRIVLLVILWNCVHKDIWMKKK